MKAAWSVKTVCLVHILRLAALYGLARYIYPLFLTPTTTALEITDRVLILLLVWLTVKRSGGSFARLGVSLRGVVRNVSIGIAAGLLLLAVSLYSERVYSAVLFLTPVQNPLVAQVQTATTARDLLMPLLLAGIMAPVAEEFLYRLLTFLSLKEKWGLWRGGIVSALLFGLMHFNLYWMGEMLVVGLGLALLYYRSGSLVSAIVAHSVVNTAKILMIFWGIPMA
jgi:membrane protease YdiL (CAAX protease family)